MGNMKYCESDDDFTYSNMQMYYSMNENQFLNFSLYELFNMH